MRPDQTAESDMSRTDWSAIRAAVSDDRDESEEAWSVLARRYWPAIYAFVRRSGHDVHSAADVTQGFICDVMMGRSLLERADPDRGRFRTLLRTALRHYLTERHRHDTRLRRAPSAGSIVPLDEARAEAQLHGGDETPDEAFDRNWTGMLIRQALAKMQDLCLRTDEAVMWEIFAARIGRPLLQEGAPIAYAVLVQQFGLRDVAQAANIALNARRRFIRLLRGTVRVTVSGDEEVDRELAELLRELERPS